MFSKYQEQSVSVYDYEDIINYEDIYYYYLDAHAIAYSDIPSSKSIYYMYTLDLDVKLQNMLKQYDFEERGEQAKVSDQAKSILEDETMTLGELEIILTRLGLFFRNTEGILINKPMQKIW